MDTHPVSHVSQDVELPSPHTVSTHIPRHTVDHDLLPFHGIAHTVLGIAVNDDGRTLHKDPQVLTGHAIDLYEHLFGDSRPDVSLAIHIEEAKVGNPLLHPVPYDLVQLPVIHILGIYDQRL